MKNNPLRYAGLATQWFIMLLIAVYAGKWIDFKIHFPALFIIILPTTSLIYSFWKLIKEVTKK